MIMFFGFLICVGIAGFTLFFSEYMTHRVTRKTKWSELTNHQRMFIAMTACMPVGMIGSLILFLQK